MGNSLQLIEKWSTKAWDKVYKAEAISSILDGEKELMKFEGTKTVRIGKPSLSGLFDYGRANNAMDGVFGGDGHDTSMAANKGYGYQQGNVSLTWETFVLRCDRGTQLRIELMDDEETDGLAVAIATTEFSRTQVIPEVDAYVFSKLHENAGTVVNTTISNSSTMGYNANGPIQALNNAFLALADAEVPENDQVIFCSNAFYNMLRSTNELVRRLDQTEYGKDVKFTIGSYEGREIIPVPANRFKTKIKLLAGGYGWETGSAAIQFIVCAKSAVYHPVKYDKVRTFSPSVVQDFDGYKVNIRIYHDCFVPDNKKPAIYCHIANTETDAITSERTIAYSAAVASKKVTITGLTVSPKGDLCEKYYLYTSGTIGSAINASATALVVDTFSASGINFVETDALSNGTYYVYGVDHGIVTAIGTTSAVVSD